MISNLFSIALLVGALLATEKVQAILFFAFLATSLIGQLAQFDLIVNMYLVDVIKEEDRYAHLNSIPLFLSITPSPLQNKHYFFCHWCGGSR